MELLQILAGFLQSFLGAISKLPLIFLISIDRFPFKNWIILIFITVILFEVQKRFFLNVEKIWLIRVLIIAFSFLICSSGLIENWLFTKSPRIKTGEYKGYHYRIMGTGSFVNSSVIMTNHHVIKGCKKIIARDKNNLYKSELIASLKDDWIDIAFIKTDANKKNFVLLSSKNAEINDGVFYPNFTDYPGIFTKSLGKVLRNIGNELELYSPVGRPGNSGSPIFNQKGYLIGLLWGGSGFLISENVTANSLTVIEKFAKENKIKLFSVKNQEEDLSKEKDFLEDRVVNLLCLQKSLKFSFEGWISAY
jgi:energy-coupling factor transporter transmembrane protein EcfT